MSKNSYRYEDKLGQVKTNNLFHLFYAHFLIIPQMLHTRSGSIGLLYGLQPVSIICSKIRLTIAVISTHSKTKIKLAIGYISDFL